MLARVLASRREAPKSLLDLWKPALVVRRAVAARSWRSRTSAPASCSSASSSRCCSGRACRGTLLVLLASPAVSLILAFSTGSVGRVVPPPARARALVQAVPRRRRGARRRERRDGRASRRSLWEQLDAVSAAPPARVPRPIARPARVGLPRHPVAGRDRLRRLVRQGLHARHAEAARVPPGAAHRLHLRRRRRGARLHRRDASR